VVLPNRGGADEPPDAGRFEIPMDKAAIVANGANEVRTPCGAVYLKYENSAT